MTGQLLDPQPKLTRLASPKVKEMIAELRHAENDPAGNFIGKLCDILDELNEQSRG